MKTIATSRDLENVLSDEFDLSSEEAKQLARRIQAEEFGPHPQFRYDDWTQFLAEIWEQGWYRPD